MALPLVASPSLPSLGVNCWNDGPGRGVLFSKRVASHPPAPTQPLWTAFPTPRTGPAALVHARTHAHTHASTRARSCLEMTSYALSSSLGRPGSTARLGHSLFRSWLCTRWSAQTCSGGDCTQARQWPAIFSGLTAFISANKKHF